MKELTELYESMGISPAVYAYGEAAIARLRERFDRIDQVAEYNQAKVLAAFRKNRVSATCFAASSGYGYNDEGRDKLEQVYADVFHTEAALVRPHITCGTHALTVALSANLLPGDELLSVVGLPYDTLQEVIGIRPSPCSLAEYGVTYRQVDLLEGGAFDYEGIRAAINEKTKLQGLCYPSHLLRHSDRRTDRLLQEHQAQRGGYGRQLLRRVRGNHRAFRCRR